MFSQFSSQVVKPIRTLWRSVGPACRDYSRDPLAHPAIDRMSLAELADLPAGELRAAGRV